MNIHDVILLVLGAGLGWFVWAFCWCFAPSMRYHSVEENAASAYRRAKSDQVKAMLSHSFARQHLEAVARTLTEARDSLPQSHIDQLEVKLAEARINLATQQIGVDLARETCEEAHQAMLTETSIRDLQHMRAGLQRKLDGYKECLARLHSDNGDVTAAAEQLCVETAVMLGRIDCDIASLRTSRSPRSS